ncbi:MAG: hypothetical protein DCC75_07525 [Proteobacteria bacterium]|nr:MAG: hypothetical protein DCC75_07525 [Pseudomonadota bacterium]
MKIFSEIERRGHEQVVFFHYPQVGLKAIVAIHNTALGPSLGGCRMRLYQDESQALDDVLRLAEGMTYKSSIAGLDIGGGKACIIADPGMKHGRRELFLQFGRCLNSLAGRYITAEDMGTSVADVMVMREVTPYAAGFSESQGGGGDPSPWTARGVFNSIIQLCESVYGSKDLKGRHVALQGVGHVGMYLLKSLKEAGARVTVCDTNTAALEEAAKKYGAEVVSIDQIYDVACDIYAPCATGQTVNRETLKRLKCKIIAGAANNQLQDNTVYNELQNRGIIYCPDFVINGGGVISVAAEYNKEGWKRPWVEDKVDDIATTVAKILDESKKRSKFPEVVAMEMAKERVKSAQEKRQEKEISDKAA